MTTPYTPSQLSLSNYDATNSTIASWVFSSPDTTVKQQSYEVKIFNNATGSLVFDSGVINSSVTQFVVPANTLVNRTVYKWQVQYTDSNGNISSWSSFSIFTCSSIPTTSITSPIANQAVTGNTITITCNYGQSQIVSQQSFRLVIYASDQKTIVQDSGTILGSTNQYTFNGLTSGTYYAQSNITSSDGLSASSGLVIFTLSYNAGAQTPNISLTPLPLSASIRIDWNNEQELPGNYVGPGATYKTGKFNQAIQVSSLGEKVYWTFPSINQFTYTNWFIPNLDSSTMTTKQIIARIQEDNHNFIQMRYDPYDSSFILEKSVNGIMMTTKSIPGLTFAAGNQIFIVIQQSSSIIGYIGINGNLYSIYFEPYSTTSINDTVMGSGGMLSPSFLADSTYGQATYGLSPFAIDDPGIISNIQYAYIGCSSVDGNEANALFDQTHLTTNILTQSQLQSIYTNATIQSFSILSVFLANFDGNLVGGYGNGTTIASWNMYRTANGIKKKIANIPYNPNSATATYTDVTPLSGMNYEYDVVTVDPNGNEGTPQTIIGSVAFDGWWLTDQTTGTSFQLYLMVSDVPIKTNYKRSLYETFGQYPIPTYAPTKYQSGKISGWIVGVNQPLTPYQQYQTLKSLIDQHSQLLLRGDEGWGMIVDCYDLTNTIPQRNHKEYNKIEFTWTEVASA